MRLINFIFICVFILELTLAEKPKPPAITYVNKVEYFTRSLTLLCRADGSPPPSLFWKKDGQRIKSGGGNLTIPRAYMKDNGIYQCVAKNTYGIAMSEKISITKAELHSFGTREEKTLIEPEGRHVTLECSDKPLSRPSGVLDWYTTSTETVITSDRIVIDQLGNLHFINLKQEDEKKTYNCTIHNSEILTRVYGRRVKLAVEAHFGPMNRKPSIAWNTKTEDVKALVGGSFELQCIPDGNPIPHVTWTTPIGEPDPLKHTEDKNRYSLTVNITELTDEGEYKCTVSSGGFQDEKVIYVDVKAHPQCKIEPSAMIVPEGSDASFTCEERREDPRDRSIITWYKNGDPLAGSSKFTLSGNDLTVRNVKKPEDMMSIQCQAKNSVGSHLSSATLTVIKATRFISVISPDGRIKRGDIAELFVAVEVDRDYAADLSFVWKKGGKPIPNDVAYTIVSNDENSTLSINTSAINSNVLETVWGEYVCLAAVGGVTAADTVATMQLFEEGKVSSATDSAGPSVGLWWVGLLVAVVLVIGCVFLIVFLLYRGPGATYPVDKRERLAGHDPVKELADDALQDVHRVEQPTTPKGTLEWHFNERAIEGDVGSLNDDGELSMKRFEEDGSFIGNYGKR